MPAARDMCETDSVQCDIFSDCGFSGLCAVRTLPVAVSFLPTVTLHTRTPPSPFDHAAPGWTNLAAPGWTYHAASGLTNHAAPGWTNQVEKVLRCDLSGWQRSLYKQIQESGAFGIAQEQVSEVLLILRYICLLYTSPSPRDS